MRHLYDKIFPSIKVRTPYDPLLVNEILPVRFTSVSETGDVDIEELPEVLAH